MHQTLSYSSFLVVEGSSAALLSFSFPTPDFVSQVIGSIEGTFFLFFCMPTSTSATQ
jgi:hypothetical protein